MQSAAGITIRGLRLGAPGALGLSLALVLSACESSLTLPGEALSSLRAGQGTPSSLRISYGDSQSGTLGTELALPFAVLVVDRYGDPVPDVTIDWKVESGGGQLSAAESVTASNGVAQSRLTLPPTSGQQQVSATLRDSDPVKSVTLGSSATPIPNVLTAALSNANPVAGETITLSVRIGDPYGNTRSDYTGTLNMSRSDALATLPASYSFTSGEVSSDNGEHTFSFQFKTAGTQRITLSDASHDLSQALMVDVRPAPAAQILLSSDLPAAATYVAGAPLAPLSVRAVDEFGNTDTSFAGSLNLVLNPNPTSASLSGASSISFERGLASVSGRLVTKPGSGYRVQISGNKPSGGAFNTLQSNPFSVVAGAPAALTAEAGAPTTAMVTTALAANVFSVVLNDAYQNPISGAAIGWTASRGTLALSSGATDSLGKAKNSLTLPSTAGALTITASYGTLTASFPLTATPAAPSQLKFAGASLFEAGSCQSLSLSVADPYNNPVAPASNTAVTLQDDYNNAGSRFYSDSSCSNPISDVTLPSGSASPLNLFFTNPFNASLPLRASTASLADALLPTNSLVKVLWIVGDRGIGNSQGGSDSFGRTIYLRTSQNRIAGVAGFQGPIETSSGNYITPTSLGDGGCVDWNPTYTTVWSHPACAGSTKNLVNPDITALTSLGMSGLSTSNTHTCGVGADGYAYCWGAAFHGEIGNGLAGAPYYDANSRILVPSPYKVASIGGNVAQVAVGGTVSTRIYRWSDSTDLYGGYSLARKSDGSVYCWGYNTCGSGAPATKTTPVLVALGEPAVDVSTGSSSIHTQRFLACAALASGAVKCWGGPYTAIQAINGITNAVKVSAGYEGGCAVLADGNVRCWGSSNSSGQLGTGDQVAPGALNSVLVPNVSNAVEVLAAGGSGTSCARLGDGTVKCWGYYTGSGASGHSSSLTPVLVSGLTSAIQLVGIKREICALKSDGRLHCWGEEGNRTKRTPLPKASIEGSPATLAINPVASNPMRSTNTCTPYQVSMSLAPQRDTPLSLVANLTWENTSVSFYNDSSCESPITSATFPKGSSLLTLFLKPSSVPANIQPAVFAEGYLPGIAPNTSSTSPGGLHFSGPATRVVKQQMAPQAYPTQGWNRAELRVIDFHGYTPQDLTAPITVTMPNLTSECGRVSGPYAAEDLGTATNTFVIPSGAPTPVSYYYRVEGPTDIRGNYSSSLGSDGFWDSYNCGCSSDCGGGD